MARRKRKRTGSQVETRAVEVEKLAIGALLDDVRRLTLGSACFVVGLLAALPAGGFAVSEWRGRDTLERTKSLHVGELATQRAKLSDQITKLGAERDRAKSKVRILTTQRDFAVQKLAQNRVSREKFSRDFATRVLDPQVIDALRRSVAKDAPDGFEDQQWLLASLVWQMKSQNGFAEFLAGTVAYRVELSFDDEGEVGFQWEEGRSAVTDILAQLFGEHDTELLAKANTSINRFGFFPVKEDQIIVRGVDGGILLASPGY